MAEKIDSDTQLSATDRQLLEEFMKRHPEINKLHVAKNFHGVDQRKVDMLPFGVTAELNSGSSVSASMIPDSFSHVCVAFELHPEFTEVDIHRIANVEEKMALFHSKLGAGPTEHDIAHKDVLPKNRGKDVNAWFPHLGKKGFVSIIQNPLIKSEEPRYLLCVVVPDLPFVADMYKKHIADGMMPAQDLAIHPIVKIGHEVAVRNAQKVADLFASTMGISLRHRSPSYQDKNGLALPKVYSLSLNPGPIRANGKVLISSGMSTWGNTSHGEKSGIFFCGSHANVILTQKGQFGLYPYGSRKVGTKTQIGISSDIAPRVLQNNMFWHKKVANELHPKIENRTNSSEVEMTIQTQLGAEFISKTKPKFWFY